MSEYGATHLEDPTQAEFGEIEFVPSEPTLETGTTLEFGTSRAEVLKNLESGEIENKDSKAGNTLESRLQATLEPYGGEDWKDVDKLYPDQPIVAPDMILTANDILEDGKSLREIIENDSSPNMTPEVRAAALVKFDEQVALLNADPEAIYVHGDEKKVDANGQQTLRVYMSYREGNFIRGKTREAVLASDMSQEEPTHEIVGTDETSGRSEELGEIEGGYVFETPDTEVVLSEESFVTATAVAEIGASSYAFTTAHEVEMHTIDRQRGLIQVPIIDLRTSEVGAMHVPETTLSSSEVVAAAPQIEIPKTIPEVVPSSPKLLSEVAAVEAQNQIIGAPLPQEGTRADSVIELEEAIFTEQASDTIELKENFSTSRTEQELTQALKDVFSEPLIGEAVVAVGVETGVESAHISILNETAEQSGSKSEASAEDEVTIEARGIENSVTEIEDSLPKTIEVKVPEKVAENTAAESRTVTENPLDQSRPEAAVVSEEVQLPTAERIIRELGISLEIVDAARTEQSPVLSFETGRSFVGSVSASASVVAESDSTLPATGTRAANDNTKRVLSMSGISIQLDLAA